MKTTLSCILLLAVTLLGGCGPTVKVSSDFPQKERLTLAFLPVEYPSEIPREKINQLYTDMRQELKNAGYIVIDDAIVRKVCSTPQCPERAVLNKKYLVDAFAELKIGSVDRNNFVAGYYNTISGELVLTNSDNKELVAVSGTQRERGGVLFNAGQLIQGVISQVNNTEMESFQKLSDKFARSLVSQIPSAKNATINADAAAVDISRVDIKSIKPEVYSICANGTPNSMASVLVNRQKSNLREISEGRYCGNFFLNETVAPSGALSVEVRSPFGNSVRKEIMASEDYVCNLHGGVSVSVMSGRNTIEVGCSGEGADKKCPENIRKCLSHRFLVFRSGNGVGPFERVAEFKAPRWQDQSSKSGQPVHYEVVAVNKNGVWSQPASLETGNDS